MLNILKQIGKISILLAGLTGLSLAINTFLHLDYLVTFFTILRRFTMVFNFGWNIPVLFSFVTLTFAVDVIVWTYVAYQWVVKHFDD